jgi:hypothetical protein
VATIKADTRPLIAVYHAYHGGMFRVRLTEESRERGPGSRVGVVLDDDDNPIGSASDWAYGGKGFAVHTRPFGGYVPLDQIEFVS